LESGRILGIELDQIAVPGLGSPGTRCSRPSGQIGEAGEMGCSGMRCTPSPLLGFEQTVGIDLSLERRHEGEPGRLGRLARVVGRVESVCTDPATKGPTGPFCLVHVQMLPRSGDSNARRFDRSLLPCWVTERSFRTPCLSRLASPSRPSRAWAGSEGVASPLRGYASGTRSGKGICVPYCVPKQMAGPVKSHLWPDLSHRVRQPGHHTVSWAHRHW
jgi:hypothetical protein